MLICRRLCGPSGPRDSSGGLLAGLWLFDEGAVLLAGVPAPDAARVDRAGGAAARVHARQAHPAAGGVRARLL